MKSHTQVVKRILFFCILSCSMALATAAEQRYFGVNLAGAEFGAGQDGGSKLPGVFNTDYTYPNQNEVDYFKAKEMNIVRLPFRWERLQHSLNGAFDTAELGRLKTFVDQTTAKGVFVLLDPHNYARYHGDLIGSSAVSVTDFANFWERLAVIFKGDSKVIFGLMNEPSNMETVKWRIAANAAIVAIRNEGASNLILVPGNGYSGGHSWLQNWYAEESPNSATVGPNGYLAGSNAEEMLNIVDSLDNYAFDIHQYLDAGFSGTQETCVSSTIGSEKLVDVTSWLQTHSKKAFLGEVGAGSNTTCLAALSDITKFIDDRPNEWLGWAYWAAGPWWGDYFMSLEPTNVSGSNPVDKPQLASLVFDLSEVEISLPSQMSISLDSGKLIFLSKVGLAYQLQKSTNLSQDSWSNVGAPISGDGLLLETDLPDTTPAEPKRFYRLEVSN